MGSLGNTKKNDDRIEAKSVQEHQIERSQTLKQNTSISTSFSKKLGRQGKTQKYKITTIFFKWLVHFLI